MTTCRAGASATDRLALHAAELDACGWCLLPAVFESAEVTAMQESLNRAFTAAESDEAVRRRGAAIYAARNVIDVCPDVAAMWRTELLQEFVSRILGPECGLVRGLFFDKPPDQTWSLPWHKDLLIAIADETVAAGYSRPRLRAGVWHTEPPVEVLEQILTLRIHLDPANADNGALCVLTGSHRTGKRAAVGFPSQMIHARPGDVLAMRPLLSHSSGSSSPETRSHRRILHLEFASSELLPGGVRWHRFLRAAGEPHATTSLS
ncbi:MAG: phytanoyl-CoA dioxygenase family protein [Planctomycetaceae bacterium]|nr:phytanoyl-CoA dioxygenase family protein [Planctomycetaceae bacterium]